MKKTHIHVTAQRPDKERDKQQQNSMSFFTCGSLFRLRFGDVVRYTGHLIWDVTYRGFAVTH